MAARNLSPRRSDFEPIRALEVLGPSEVRVTYSRLHAPALYSWMMGVLPEHLLNDAKVQALMDGRDLDPAKRATFGMRDLNFNRAPIGTGPLQFVTWRSDELIELERFVFRLLPDLFTQDLEFNAGVLDSYVP